MRKHLPIILAVLVFAGLAIATVQNTATLGNIHKLAVMDETLFPDGGYPMNGGLVVGDDAGAPYFYFDGGWYQIASLAQVMASVVTLDAGGEYCVGSACGALTYDAGAFYVNGVPLVNPYSGAACASSGVVSALNGASAPTCVTNVPTATALVGDPADCTAQQFALGITASGAATCGSLTCAGGEFVTSATGTLSCATPTGTFTLDAGTNIEIVGGSNALISVKYPLLAPDGTVSAPSYSFTNNHDAGMWYSAAGVWLTDGPDAGYVVVTPSAVEVGNLNSWLTVDDTIDVEAQNSITMTAGSVVSCTTPVGFQLPGVATASLTTPTSALAGTIQYDTTTQSFKYTDGGVWNSMVSGWPILAPSGLTASPSYSFSSCPTCGMYESGNYTEVSGSQGVKLLASSGATYALITPNTLTFNSTGANWLNTPLYGSTALQVSSALRLQGVAEGSLPVASSAIAGTLQWATDTQRFMYTDGGAWYTFASSADSYWITAGANAFASVPTDTIWLDAGVTSLVVNGQQLDLGTGASDYFTSNGTIISTPGSLSTYVTNATSYFQAPLFYSGTNGVAGQLLLQSSATDAQTSATVAATNIYAETALTANDLLLTVAGNDAGTRFSVDYEGDTVALATSSATTFTSTLSTGGSFDCSSTTATCQLSSAYADGATAVAVTVGPQANYATAGGKLFSVAHDADLSTEVYSIGYDGAQNATGKAFESFTVCGATGAPSGQYLLETNNDSMLTCHAGVEWVEAQGTAHPVETRHMAWLHLNPGNNNFGLVGWTGENGVDGGLGPTWTDSVAASNAMFVDRSYRAMAAATENGSASIIGHDTVFSITKPRFEARIVEQWTLDDGRYWLGFSSSAAMVDSDRDGDKYYCMIRYSQPAGDTKWQLCSGDGTDAGCTSFNSVGPNNTGKGYRMTVELTEEMCTGYLVDVTGGTNEILQKTDSVPATGHAMVMTVLLKKTSGGAGAVILGINSLSQEQQ